MRKLSGVLSVVVLASMFLSACSKEKDVVSSTEKTGKQTVSASGKEVPIKLWIYPMMNGKNGDGNGNPDDWAKEYARQFKEKHPNVNVSVELLDWAGGTEKIDVSIAAGSPPDLVYTINNFGGVTKYGKMGVLEPIDPFLEQADWNDYSEAVKGAMKYKDKTYLWPWLKLVSGIAINMDLFKERNAVDLLPLNRPLRDWTFEEFTKAAQATTFSRSNGSKPDVYGTGVWAKDAPYYMYFNGVANGGNVTNSSFDKTTITDPKFVEGVQFSVDLANKYKVSPPGAAGLTVTNVNDMFLNQQVAMYPSFSNITDQVKKAPKPFEVAFVAPPHGPGQETTAWNNVGGFIAFKQKDEEKKKLVMEFAKFITNTENSKIVKTIAVFPARNSTGNLYGDDPVMSYFDKLSNYGNSLFSRAFGMAPVADWEIEFQANLTGARSVKDSLGNLEKTIQKELK
ncbi:sugar ABC transporter substrate-binding protein [Paenibacillus sp. HWE-109]|uniref:ABC transporter substrate-binding protein n=1 Tax=Paenibacillus sp. HWE-109 TaxID=1306526 RepID=UPI001EDCBB1F|nr:sugar ABC transporter substrate-binding protein [Paenibacillus sp. HWE-109]UKS28292.1 sugar ABC transporter substrate-binding protein [Paenibacillus sp. HWE-109]